MSNDNNSEALNNGDRSIAKHHEGQESRPWGGVGGEISQKVVGISPAHLSAPEERGGQENSLQEPIQESGKGAPRHC